jgi:ElaB/YqjD/DUF883 family membrane-anchored ribosome-binding protein
MANENNPAGASAQDNPFDATKAHLKQTADDLKSAAGAKAEELRAAAGAKADELRHRAEEVYGQARQRAEEYYGEARNRAEQAYGEAREKARTFQEDGEAYVREQPLRAVAVALGAGFVLGLLFRR